MNGYVRNDETGRSDDLPGPFFSVARKVSDDTIHLETRLLCQTPNTKSGGICSALSTSQGEVDVTARYRILYLSRTGRRPCWARAVGTPNSSRWLAREAGREFEFTATNPQK